MKKTINGIEYTGVVNASAYAETESVGIINGEVIQYFHGTSLVYMLIPGSSIAVTCKLRPSDEALFVKIGHVILDFHYCLYHGRALEPDGNNVRYSGGEDLFALYFSDRMEYVRMAAGKDVTYDLNSYTWDDESYIRIKTRCGKPLVGAVLQ